MVGLQEIALSCVWTAGRAAVHGVCVLRSPACPYMSTSPCIRSDHRGDPPSLHRASARLASSAQSTAVPCSRLHCTVRGHRAASHNCTMLHGSCKLVQQRYRLRLTILLKEIVPWHGWSVGGVGWRPGAGTSGGLQAVLQTRHGPRGGGQLRTPRARWPLHTILAGPKGPTWLVRPPTTAHLGADLRPGCWLLLYTAVIYSRFLLRTFFSRR